MNMLCGHCGTEVKDGFTVCAGCGALYKKRFGFVYWIIVPIVLMLGVACILDFLIAVFTLNLTASMFMRGIFDAVAVALSVSAFRLRNDKLWYRKNG